MSKRGLGVAGLLAAAACGGDSVPSERTVDVAVPMNPNSIAVADFDEDGAPDLVVTSENNAAGICVATILPHAAAGSAAPLASDGPPASVVTGDLTGDGHADFLVVSWDGAMSWPMSLYPGDGRGGFAPLQVIAPAGLFPMGPVALADLDGDGALDIVVRQFDSASFGPAGFTVLFGPGFTRMTTADGATIGIAVADMDGDGHLDVVTADGVYRGDGSGNFGAPIALPDGSNATSVATGDLDGDGHVDAVLVSAASVIVLWGDGSGGFAATSTAISLAYDGTDAPIAIADLDGDGMLDVAIGRSDMNLSVQGDQVAVLHNDGGRAFTLHSAQVSLGTATGLAAANLDGSGAAQLAATNTNGSSISLLYDP